MIGTTAESVTVKIEGKGDANLPPSKRCSLPECAEVVIGSNTYCNVHSPQLNYLRAEVAAMRPIVEAAQRWRDARSIWADDSDLANAIDEYRKGKQ